MWERKLASRTELIEKIIIDPIQQWRDLDLRINGAETRRFLQHELDLVFDPELRGALGEMPLGAGAIPTGACHAVDELLAPLIETRHAAVRVRDQRHRAHAADGDRVRNAKFVVAHVRAGGAQYEGEIVRDAQRLPAVHAHADEQLRTRLAIARPAEVMVLEEMADGPAAIDRQDVLWLCDGNDLRHGDKVRSEERRVGKE